jgi:hypothetical protein
MLEKISVVSENTSSSEPSKAARRLASRYGLGNWAVLPFEVRIDMARRGRFDDVRDAIASARITKHDFPLSQVSVADLTTGQIVIEIVL